MLSLINYLVLNNIISIFLISKSKYLFALVIAFNIL